jgi:hypothetical protein
MFVRRVALAVALVAVTLAVSSAQADVPGFVNYQGILTDTGGMPLDGTYDLTFEIFDVPSGGTNLWSESHLGETIDDGLLNVFLGPIDLAIFDDDSLWMQVTVDSDVIIPRTQLTSVPWAFRAAVAETALTVSELPAHDHNDLYYTESELNTPGVINNALNPVDWTKLKSVPAGFADGVDDVGAGSSNGWVDDGTVVRLETSSDYVGIGTSTPSVKLDVRGRLYVGAPGDGYNVMFHGWASDVSGLWWLGSPLSLVMGRDTNGSHWDTVGNYSISAGYNNKPIGNSAASFGSWNTAGGDQTLASGYRAMAMGLRSVALGSNVDAQGEASVAIGEAVSARADNSIVMGTGLVYVDTLANYTPNSFMVGFGGDPMLFVDGDNDRVGIGTIYPQQALQVLGTAQVNGFKMPTGASDGYVLTSDASGVGTWQSPATVSDGDWTVSGSDIYSAVAGNVGIGTSTPSSKLDVDGEINTSSTYEIGGNTVLSIAGSYNNTLVGEDAGENNTSFELTAVGKDAGYSNQGARNTFVGSGAGYSNTTGVGNTFLGQIAGRNNTTGYDNVFVGRSAGSANTDGALNTFVGAQAGQYNSSGYNNIFVGYGAGRQNTSGEGNTFVGLLAGYSNTTGIRNVFLGHYAGYNETGSQRLYIDNSTTSSPLIYGEFDNNIVNVNGKLGIDNTSPTYSIDAVSYGYALRVGNPNSWLEVSASGNTQMRLGDGNGYNAGSITATENGSGMNILSLRASDDFGNTLFGINLQEDDRVAIGKAEASSETQVHIETSSDNFGVLVDASGDAGTEIGLHTATSRYGSLVKNAYFTSGNWYRFSDSYGAYLHEILPTGEIRFKTAPSAAGAVSWTTCMTLQTDGDVGIGTTSPAYKLQVGNAGDGSQARANAWNILSSRDYKSDITPFDRSEYHDALEKLKAMDVVKYRFSNDDARVVHVGVIAEESPSEILAADGKAVSLGDYTSFLLAALKAQQEQIELQSVQIEEQKERIENLEEQVSILR